METRQNSTSWLQGLGPIQNRADIDSLIDEEVPEGDHLEFKQDLSAPKGHATPWEPGKKLNRDAKKPILQEVVAFANAYGGTLLLGIVESKTTPPVAAKVQALPHCAALSEHLKMVFRDCVDPPLPYLQIHPVLTEEDEGVVVIHAGRSYLSPHRVTLTRECPIRRADRCENMTMREIQDMCMNTARGLERLERQLEARAQRFKDVEVASLQNPEKFVAVRFTAAPTVDVIGIDPVFHRNSLIKTLNPSGLNIQWQLRETAGIFESPFNSELVAWKPMLRAARADPWPSTPVQHRGLFNSYAEIHHNGLVELGHLSNFTAPIQNAGNLLVLPEAKVLVWASYVLAWADLVRRQAHAPMAEYVLNVEIMVQGGSCFMPTGFVDSQSIFRHGFSIAPTIQTFPPYPLRDVQDLGSIVSRFRRDLWNWQGQNAPEELGFTLVGT